MSATTGVPTESRVMLLDLFERVAVSLLLSLLAARFLPSILQEGNAANALLFFSEAMVVAFIVFRRRAQSLSLAPMDWLVGFAGTVIGLLVVPGHGAEAVAPQVLIVALMGGGFLLQVAAKLTLRRSFGVVAANRGVKASGPYRLVRHPMYAGYLLTQVGFLLAAPMVWNVVVYAALWGVQVLRIRAEERVLRCDPAYQALAGQVRWRLVPGLW